MNSSLFYSLKSDLRYSNSRHTHCQQQAATAANTARRFAVLQNSKVYNESKLSQYSSNLLYSSSRAQCSHNAKNTFIERRFYRRQNYLPTNTFSTISATVFKALCLCIALSITVSVASGLHMRTVLPSAGYGSRSGMMRLCPPGGESFASAWQMACGMRKRKKRDASQPPTDQDGNLIAEKNKTKYPSEILNEKTVQAIAGAAVREAEPLAKLDGVIIPSTVVGRLDDGMPRRKRNLPNFNENYYSYSNEKEEEDSSREYHPFTPIENAKLGTVVLTDPVADIGLNLLRDDARHGLGTVGRGPQKGDKGSYGANIKAEIAKERLAHDTRPAPSLHPKTGFEISSDLAAMLAEFNRDDNRGGGNVARLEAAIEREENALLDARRTAYRAPSISEMMMVCCRYDCSLRDLLPYCSPFGDWDSY